MKGALYIYAENGFAADAISTSVATTGLTAKRGDELALAAIFHDGSEATELPADATGSFMAKVQKGFTTEAVLQAAGWTKQPAPGDGYLFAIAVTGGALDELIGAAESLALMCEISWTTGGVRTTTPTVGLTIWNNLTR